MKANGRRRWRRLARKHRQKCAHDAMRAVYSVSQAMKDRRTGYELKPLPPPVFSPRSLVGMSQRRRKQLYHQLFDTQTDPETIYSGTWSRGGLHIGERLRPCPNPFCSKEDGCSLRGCHGSGVLPANR